MSTHTIPKQVATYCGLNWFTFNILTSIALYTCAALFHELVQEPAGLNSPLYKPVHMLMEVFCNSTDCSVNIKIGHTPVQV